MTTHTKTQVQPIPPRFWWLKRIAAGCLVLLIMVVALRLWWGWEAHQRLQSRIDELVAAGEPVYPEDFNPTETIPDDQNAARMLEDAVACLTFTNEQEKLLYDKLLEPGGVERHLEQTRAIIEANTECLELVRQARDASGVDWGMRYSSTVFQTFYAGYSGLRSLARFLGAAVDYYHEIGDDGEAIRVATDAIAQARTMEQDGTIIAHLVAIACDALVVKRIESIAPDLQISKDGAPTIDSRNPASRVQIAGLIADLLDESAYRDGLARAMQRGRMAVLNLIQLCANGYTSFLAMLQLRTPVASSLGEQVLFWLARPLLELDGVTAIEHTSALIQAAQASSLPSAMQNWPKELKRQSPLDLAVHPVSNLWLGSLDRSFVLTFRVWATRRMGAIAVAIRLYELDHGQRPETLSKLVPDYLPAVPLDPLAPDGRPVGYLPDADPPILYCVGEDGVDDGGRYELRESGHVDFGKLDQPFFLNGDRPHPANDEESSTGETVNGQDDTESNKGQGEEDQHESG